MGKTLRLELRNGIMLNLPLLAVGPFDVLVGEKDKEIFIPLHAMLRWNADGGAAASQEQAQEKEGSPS